MRKYFQENCIRKISVSILAVGRPQKPIQVYFRCADGCQRQVGAIATGDNKQEESKEEVAMIVDSNARIDPTQCHQIYYAQGSHLSHEIKFKDFSRNPSANFQALNVDISSYHYTLCDISLTVILHAVKLKPH